MQEQVQQQLSLAAEEAQAMANLLCPVCTQVKCVCTPEELAAATNALAGQQGEATVDEAMDEMREVPESQADTVYELLSEIEGHPSEAQIDQWKTQHGGVFSMIFTEDDIYLFRSITREEWSAIQSHPAAQNPAGREEYITYQTVDRCLLWPTISPQQWLKKQAGLQDSLCNMVMLNSYFLSQSQAVSLVVKL